MPHVAMELHFFYAYIMFINSIKRAFKKKILFKCLFHFVLLGIFTVLSILIGPYIKQEF